MKNSPRTRIDFALAKGSREEGAKRTGAATAPVAVVHSESPAGRPPAGGDCGQRRPDPEPGSGFRKEPSKALVEKPEPPRTLRKLSQITAAPRPLQLAQSRRAQTAGSVAFRRNLLAGSGVKAKPLTMPAISCHEQTAVSVAFRRNLLAGSGAKAKPLTVPVIPRREQTADSVAFWGNLLAGSGAKAKPLTVPVIPRREQTADSVAFWGNLLAGSGAKAKSLTLFKSRGAMYD